MSGLRERKKQLTRTAIADAALPLFLARGFEEVTVADVARAADVAVTTVFNYFPAKEDLFFDRQAEVEQHPAQVVRSRPAGIDPAAALQADYLEAVRQKGSRLGIAPGAAAFHRTVRASPALLARERELGERMEAELAAAIGGPEPGFEARLEAALLAGVLSTLAGELRRRLLAGQSERAVRAALARRARTGFGRLSR